MTHITKKDPVHLPSYVKARAHSHEKKGNDLTQSYDKSPYAQNNQNSNMTTQKTPPKLSFHNDYGPTWDGKRSHNSHPTGVVKLVNDRSTFPLTAAAMSSK